MTDPTEAKTRRDISACFDGKDERERIAIAGAIFAELAAALRDAGAGEDAVCDALLARAIWEHAGLRGREATAVWITEAAAYLAQPLDTPPIGPAAGSA